MSQTPAGWYPDPYAQGQPLQRYWDGAAWTEHVNMLPPAPYGVKTTPDGQILSGWWRRVGAQVIDGIIIFVLLLPVYIPVMIPLIRESYRQALDAAQNGQQAPLFPSYSAGEIGGLAVVSVVALVLYLVYNAGFLRWKNGTPGKLLLGIRIRVREASGQLPWDVIFKRMLVQSGYAFVSWIPLLGSLAGLWPLLDDLWPLWDDKKQAVHEKWAGTNVVRHDQWARTSGQYGE